ncbi:MAG: hypothetical protein QGF09_07925 [Rhodospirillales bacterium]|nr:hypothetical protein [Rhodospirillales bacterium]
MAEIVFGVGSSHSPMLGTDPDIWDQFAIKDTYHPPAHPFRGGFYPFEELREFRKGENLAAENSEEKRWERHHQNQKNLDRLGDEIAQAKLDVLVIIGDDQRECFMPDNSPAFLIYNGEAVLNKVANPERLAQARHGIAEAAWMNVPEGGDIEHPGEPDLANRIIAALMGAEFDIAVSQAMPAGKFGENGIPHAYGFFYHRLMDDMKKTPGMSTLPIFINTFYPPNQPSVRRVLRFGEVIGDAIRSWDSDKKVGIAASGGFSHFAIDEELDMRIIRAMEAGDEATILAEPEYSFQAGNSEIKNWLATQAAVAGSGLKFELIDYIPCYRSDAGTGNANTFGVWS